MSIARITNQRSALALRFDEHLFEDNALTVHFTIWLSTTPDVDCIAAILKDMLHNAWEYQSEYGNLNTISSASPWLVETINEPDYDIEGTVAPIEYRLIFRRCRDLDSRLGGNVVEKLWADLSQLPSELDDNISSIMLRHPNPVRQFQRNYSRCAVLKPWIGESPPKPQRQHYTAPGFYDGPLLGAARLRTIVSKYAPFSPHIRFVSNRLQRLDLVSSAFSKLVQDFPIVSNREGQPKDAIQEFKDAGEAVKTCFPTVRHLIEECLETLDDIVRKTRDSNTLHDSRDICTAIHALLELRKGSPAFTDSWQLWTDTSNGKLLAHGAVAVVGVLVLAGGVAAGATLMVMAAPVSAPAVAAGTVAAAPVTGSTVAAASTMTAPAAAGAKGMVLSFLKGCSFASAACTTASGVAIASNEGYNTYKSIRDLVDMEEGITINSQIDAELKGAAYYLTLGLMECSGIANARHSARLNQVLAEIDGIHPARSKSMYRAEFLSSLVNKIWEGFQDLQKKMRDRGLEPAGGWLEYIPDDLPTELLQKRII